MNKAELIQEVLRIQRTCRGPISSKFDDIKNRYLAEGNLEGAQYLDNMGRTPCGQDINLIIISFPFDGQLHEYTCPTCGMNDILRTPLED